MSKPASYVQPIHFEDFDGAQFERLVTIVPSLQR
jgi:hypothetical protein